MNGAQLYQISADFVLALHFCIVMFVVGGLLLIVSGNLLSWAWVNRLWLRVVHLSAIAVVVGGSWLGTTCPLTTLEAWLRAQGGLRSYEGSFIEHWVQKLIFYEGPPWVFTMLYTIFGLAVVAVWYYFPPKGRRGSRASGGS